MPGSKNRYDLLAPVPLIHILSALSKGPASDIAFGSEKTQMFGNLTDDVIIDMRVWIYASATGSQNLDPALRQRVCFVGDFGGSTEAGMSFVSVDAVRPPSAKAGDSSWAMFWLVRNLQPVKPPHFYSFFRSAKTKKQLLVEPRGPMLVCRPL